MDLQDLLKRLNYSPKEAAIYLACLSLGTCTASQIAKKTNIQRTHVYDICKKLVEKGTIKTVRKATNVVFNVVDPRELLEKQEQTVELLKQSLSALESLKNTSNEKARVTYYEGMIGIKQVNNDTLLEKNEIVGFTTPKFLLINDTNLSKEYIQNRIKKKIKVRAIGGMSDEIISLKNDDRKELRQTKILPKNIFSSDVEIGIYNKKVFIVDYVEEFGLVIESKKINHTLKQIFEIIWNSGKIID